MGHVVRTELRAFPRFACSTLARLVAGEIDADGQVIDLSREGCKMLPFRLAPLIEAGLVAGAALPLAPPSKYLASPARQPY